MNEKLKKAFDQIRAEDELKNRTRDYIFRKTKGYNRSAAARRRYLLPSAACILFFLIGGYWLYFIPTVRISIDINPSLELGVNRFDRIVSVRSFNDDGNDLQDSLDIKYLDYSEAVDQIIKSDKISSLLADDEVLVIAVIGTDDAQSEQILSVLQSQTAEQSNTCCYYAHAKEAEEAHNAGLSYGKYQAFLELQKLDPDITAEEAQNMTMWELRERISSLSEHEELETEAVPSENEHHEEPQGEYHEKPLGGHHGNGGGHGSRSGHK